MGIESGRRGRGGFTRRRLLEFGVGGAAVAMGYAATGPAVVGAGDDRDGVRGELPDRPHPSETSGREVHLSLRLADATIRPAGKPVPAMLVNDRFPAPEIRLRRGDLFRATVANALSMPATLHWHGLLLPNPMDGVPGITQAPIEPDGIFVYEFPIRQTGSYWYHSHYQFQEQVGVGGPLIIESANEPRAYDHDVVLFLSDWMNRNPWDEIAALREAAKRGMAAMSGAGRSGDRSGADDSGAAGRMPGSPGMVGMGMATPAASATINTRSDGTTFEADVEYDAYLVNGQPPGNPFTVKARSGDRVRLRVINGSASTYFSFAIDGHPVTVIEADGQAVDPVVVDGLVLGMGETYDLLVRVGESGAWGIRAAALGETGGALAVLHTPDAKPVPGDRPAPSGPRLLRYEQLRAPEPTTLPEGPVKQLRLELGGDMSRYLWSIGGQYFPTEYVPDGKADSLRISPGDRVAVEIVNRTSMDHPMHLHGHFFRLLARPGADAHAPLKHTVTVAPGETTRFEFVADNPGRWFFHCHNVYHLETGMARVFEYVIPR